MFFSPFQMYMTRYIPDGKAGIVRSTALYTGSWSLGFALGPVLFGLLTMKAAYLTCMGLALVMTLGFILLEMFPQRPCTGSVNTLPQPGVDYSRFPDMVWLGYLVGGVGCVVIAFVRTMGPFRGVQVLNLSKEEMGLVIAAVSFMQSLTGYLLYFSREWMYRKLPGLLLNCCGMAALLCFAFGNNFVSFLTAALLCGIYSGSFFFFFVFHSLVHPTKSARYVAGNETIVGATGVVGPLLGGAFITPASSHWVFIVGAVFVFIALAGQQIMLRRAKIN
jgi:MFS family permease